MKDTLTYSVLALLTGAFLILGSGTSFGGNAGVIMFCYGLFGVGYVCCKKLF